MNDKAFLEKTLGTDFEQNEAVCLNGIATENGILILKARWKAVAMPVVMGTESLAVPDLRLALSHCSGEGRNILTF